MRKITRDAVNAFTAGRKFTSGNTSITVDATHVRMTLHGNEIARRPVDGGPTEISDGGWETLTTRERLNGIPGVHVYQRDYVQHLNGSPWDGSWTAINA